MKTINVDCVVYNQNKNITRLETTVMMETTVSTTAGIDYCQDGNCCQDRDHPHDGDEHAHDQPANCN